LDPDFIAELFAQFRPVTVRRMFGGAGIYAEGFLFALAFDGAIYLKVDATSIPDFEREGCTPFVYSRAKSAGRVGRHSLSYWRMPERLTTIPTNSRFGPAVRSRSRNSRRPPRGRGPRSRHQGGRRDGLSATPQVRSSRRDVCSFRSICVGRIIVRA
jgi:DNA transformation protein and related proteins